VLEALADDGRYRCWEDLPRGAVVAVARLRTVAPVEDLRELAAREKLLGDYRPARYGWLLADVTPVDPPVPARAPWPAGARLWTLTPAHPP